MWQLFLKGGAVMWPILICSIFALAIILEKLYFLHKNSIDDAQLFLKDIKDKLKRHDIKEAVKLCDQQNTSVSRVVKAAILKFDRGKEEIKEAIEETALYEIPHLEKNLNMLATIAHISPLLGLLGTVTGMVKCFYTIQTKTSTFNPVSAADLAGGIWEALLTTVFGLVVAIPTFVAYNYLVGRVNHVILEMEQISTEIVNFLHNN
ncbi:MAG: MotA/TolQ/ExbB proton channel family protein [Candidatus Omnitrophica bacterium]|nr:MotA/TolQ/ExbB proton channel family protein [Candidatus Omnitrophota bacterium]